MAQISVIVAVYKMEQFLPRCIQSILNQTFSDLELILVDDGSPDNCGSICDDYARRDSRVSVIHKENAGVCAARNTGLDWVFEKSHSRWIFFHDNDDWMHPNTLEWMLQAAEETNTQICVCGYAQTTGADPEIRPETLKPVLWTPKAFYMEHFVNATVCWGKLYAKACFAGRRYPEGKYMEDEFLTYRLLFAQEKLCVIPAPLYAYFVNPTGITKRAWVPKRLDAWEAYEEQLAFFEAMGDEELLHFRYRGYLDNAMVNWAAAKESIDVPNRKAILRKMKKQIRGLIRRAWRGGHMEFWIDFDILYEFYPYFTRAFRFWIEIREWFRRDHHG